MLFISWQKNPCLPFSPDLSADRQVEAASFYSGFQNKRYSVQQENSSQKYIISLL
jgi:hypothetical protein